MQVVFGMAGNFKPVTGLVVGAVLVDGQREGALYNQAFAVDGVDGGVDRGVGLVATEHDIATVRAQVKNIQLILTFQEVIRFVLK